MTLPVDLLYGLSDSGPYLERWPLFNYKKIDGYILLVFEKKLHVSLAKCSTSFVGSAFNDKPYTFLIIFPILMEDERRQFL